MVLLEHVRGFQWLLPSEDLPSVVTDFAVGCFRYERVVLISFWYTLGFVSSAKSKKYQ